MDLDLYGVGAVAGDGLVDLGVAAGEEARDPAAAGGADDVGEVDVAPHGREAKHQLTGTGQRRWRLMALVLEVSHLLFVICHWYCWHK